MSDPSKKTEAKPEPAAAKAPPLSLETVKPLLDALEKSESLKLDRASAALFLAHLVVAKGESWVRSVDPKTLLVERDLFANSMPPAWLAIVNGHAHLLVTQLGRYSVDHVEPADYKRLADALSSPAPAPAASAAA